VFASGFRAKGQTASVGKLDDSVVEFLADKGVTQNTRDIVINDNVLLRMVRDTKTAGLPREIIADLPSIMAKPTAVLWDKTKGNLLYVFDVPGETKLGKLVIEVSFKIKQTRVLAKRNVLTNSVRSGALIDPSNLTEAQGFEFIFGNP
jgi:hypothetical protein